MNKRYKKIVIIVAWNIIILIIGLVSIELIFGGWLRSSDINYLNIPYDVDAWLDTSSLYPSDSDKAHYIRDKYGLRGRYSSPSDIGILTIGGSTTDQRYISEGQTWQDVLAREFHNHGVEISVVNAGIDGQSSIGHLLNFDYWFPYIPQLQPKYILYYIGVNESFADINPGHYDDLLRQKTLSNVLTVNSAFYRIYRTLVGVRQARRAGLVHKRIDFDDVHWVGYGKFIAEDQQCLDAMVSAYRRRLNRIVQRTRDLSAEPIFVTQQHFSYREVDGRLEGADINILLSGCEKKFNGFDNYQIYRAINRATLDIGLEFNVICLNLAEDIEFSKGEYYDWAHTTPAGSEKIGVYLYRELSRHPDFRLDK